MTVSHLTYGKQITSWHVRIVAPISKMSKVWKRKNSHSPKTIVRKRGEGVKPRRNNGRWEGRWPLTKIARHWDTHIKTPDMDFVKNFTRIKFWVQSLPHKYHNLCCFEFQYNCQENYQVSFCLNSIQTTHKIKSILHPCLSNKWTKEHKQN